MKTSVCWRGQIPGAACLLIAGWPTAGVAASVQADGQSSGHLEEVVVTATRRETKIEDVPYNITALGGKEIEQLNIVDLSKLTRSIAGLQITDRGPRDNTTSSRLIARGLNTESADIADLPFVTAPAVATYVDDAPVFANLRLYDIQQVEFLRGPQGTLYGSGSLGGALRYIHNRPDTKAFTISGETGVSATDGANGPNYSVNSVLNAPLSGRTALRISAGHDYYHGFIDDPVHAQLGSDSVALPADPADPLNSAPATERRNDINDGSVTYVHGAIRSELTDRINIQLNYHYQRDFGRNRDAQSALPGARAREVLTLLDEPSTRHVQVASLDLNDRLDAGTLTFNSSYYTTGTNAVLDGTGLYEALGYRAIPRMTFPIPLDSRRHALTEEFRFASNRVGSWDWIAGLYYHHESAVDIDEHDIFRGDGLLGHPNTDANDLFLHLYRETVFKDAAAFGEVTYHLGEVWQVTAGSRAFDQRFESSGYFDYPLFGLVPGDVSQSHDTGTLWKLNVAADLSPAAKLYATWSQGFRRGGANSIPTAGPLAEPGGLVSYKPDRVNNFEVGVKGSSGEDLHYSAAVFHIDWSNPQIGTLSPINGFDIAINATDAKSDGVELELSGVAGQSLRYGFGYSYTESRLGSGMTGIFAAPKGARLPGVSRNSVSGSLDYTVPMRAGMKFVMHADASYRSNFVNNLDSGATQYRVFPGFSVVGASLSMESGRWRVSLYGENLANVLGISAQNDPAQNSPAYYVEWITRPRTVGLTTSFNF
jgi:outer membrane receptor protein involved in Fe transport